MRFECWFCDDTTTKLHVNEWAMTSLKRKCVYDVIWLLLAASASIWASWARFCQLHLHTCVDHVPAIRITSMNFQLSTLFNVHCDRVAMPASRRFALENYLAGQYRSIALMVSSSFLCHCSPYMFLICEATWVALMLSPNTSGHTINPP